MSNPKNTKGTRNSKGQVQSPLLGRKAPRMLLTSEFFTWTWRGHSSTHCLNRSHVFYTLSCHL